MPFDGSGNYTPAAAPNFPAVGGSTISSAYYNNVINDIASALSNCLTRDGQGKPTVDLNWNGKSLTNAATIGAVTGTFSGNGSFGGTLGVTGAVTLSSTLAVTGGVTLSAGITGTTATFSGAGSFGTLTAGATTLSGALVGTTATFSGALTVNADVSVGANLVTGNGVSTGNAALELGGTRTGSGAAFMDLHATSGSDFEARLVRNSGLNGTLNLINTGSGTISFDAAAGGGVTQFSWGGVVKAFVDSSGTITAAGNLIFSNVDRSVTWTDTGGANPRLVFQNDNNWVFYNTDASGAQRAIFSSQGRNSTSPLLVYVPLSLSTALSIANGGTGATTAAAALAAIGGLGVSAASLGSNGYIKFTNGLVLQWGIVAVSDDQYNSVTFPLAFPNAVFAAFATPVYSTSLAGTSAMGSHVGSITLTGMFVGHSSTTTDSTQSYWFAIGN